MTAGVARSADVPGLVSLLLLCSWHRQLPCFGINVTRVFYVNGPPSPDALGRVLSPPQEATKHLPHHEEAGSPGRGVCVCARPRQQVGSGSREDVEGATPGARASVNPRGGDGQDRPGRKGKGSERAFHRLGLEQTSRITREGHDYRRHAVLEIGRQGRRVCAGTREAELA